LSADLDRANVESLAHESAELLASGVAALRFDGSAVARVRLSSVQMLASAARSAAAAGVPFELCTPSVELTTAIQLCGLSDLILSSEGETVQ
jgi:anti-anti-sigma regulatory factor